MKFIYLIVLIFLGTQALPQSLDRGHTGAPLPVEVLAGHRSVYYQQVVSKDIFGDAYNFFNVTNFDAQSGNDLSKNTFLISSFLSKKLGNGFSVGLGGEIQNPGAFLIAGAQYTYVNEKLLLVLFPSVNLNGASALSQLSLLEFKPRISDKISAYLSTQFLVVTNFEAIFRSYQQLRVGLQIQHVQFGYAMNLDQFDDFDISLKNFGIFLRLLTF